MVRSRLLASQRGARRAPVALGGQHLHQLAATGDQRLELLALRVGQGARLGLDALGELRQDPRVDAVGLGQLSAGLSEVAHLARIDSPRRDAGAKQRGQQLAFVAAGGFQHHQRGTRRRQPLEQPRDPVGVVATLPLLAARQRHRQAILGHVDSNIQLHRQLPPMSAGSALPCAIRACLTAPQRLFGLQAGVAGAATMLSHGLYRPRAYRPAAPCSATILLR